jgi:predicted permease
MLAVQPAALVVLDRLTGRGSGAPALLRRMATNPLTVATVIGVVLAVTGRELPTLAASPLVLLGGAAIPMMLLSYGAALRLSPPVGRSGHNREVVLVGVLKLLVMPVTAFLLGVALDLHDRVLLGVVITAALPTAQNIFLHATRYRVGEDLARESILITTLASLPVVLVVAVLLG